MMSQNLIARIASFGWIQKIIEYGKTKEDKCPIL